MKICIAIEKFNPHVGGAERYCWDFAHFLAERGHEVEIICIKAKDPLHPSIHIIEVMCIRFPQALRHLSFAVMHYLKARSLPEHIHFCVGNTFYMDVYQPHGGLHRAWFLHDTLRYPDYLRKYIRFAKRLSLKDVVQRELENRIFRKSRPEIIAISKMVARDIRSWFNCPDKMIHVIPNGIDRSKFSTENKKYALQVRSRYGLKPEDFIFLFVANNLTLKGFDVLLRACRMLDHLDFKVLVVGTEDVRNRKKDRDLSDVIRFAGRSEDLEKIYPACDCLVHPSYYDACSLVVLEALASGIVVITTSTNGASMFITKDNGHVIDPDDPGALAAAMSEVYYHKGPGIAPMQFQDQVDVFSKVERVLLNISSKNLKG
ncbi:MAG: glycosyltransferase family 4 protein [Deltaproteobacteria bacterium]|nr:glycosyltransferase family 4 protein [Deltaproteobacteria bacterium]